MPIYASSNGNMEKAPTGLIPAVCIFVNDIGPQRGEYQGKPKITHQIIVTWELSEKFTTGDLAGQPFTLSKFYTLSLSEKANLRNDIESWRGKKFSEEELAGFDVEKLVGAPCMLNVTATEKDKRKVSAVTPMPKGMNPIPATIIEPSEGYSKWINGLREKSVVLEAVDVPRADPPVDDMPF
jgi:hypothetical protein